MFLEMMIFIIYIINGDTFLRGKNHFVGGVGWGNTPNIFTKLLQKKNMGQNVTKQKKKKIACKRKKIMQSIWFPLKKLRKKVTQP